MSLIEKTANKQQQKMTQAQQTMTQTQQTMTSNTRRRS